jgi:phosphatidylserine decarboxylase
VCRVAAGEKVEAGQRIGLIRFGSRTDCYMPRATRVHVARGDHVVGGETILGTLP